MSTQRRKAERDAKIFEKSLRLTQLLRPGVPFQFPPRGFLSV